MEGEAGKLQWERNDIAYCLTSTKTVLMTKHKLNLGGEF